MQTEGGIKKLGLVFGSILIVGLFWISAIYLNIRRNSSGPQPAVPKLQAVVAWEGEGIAVKNVDPQKRTLRNVVLKLNHIASQGDIKAGSMDIDSDETVVIPFSSFVDNDLQRFNVFTTAIETIYLKGELEPGITSSRVFVCVGQTCRPVSEKGEP